MTSSPKSTESISLVSSYACRMITVEMIRPIALKAALTLVLMPYYASGSMRQYVPVKLDK